METFLAPKPMLLSRPLRPLPLCPSIPGLFAELLLCARHYARYWQTDTHMTEAASIFTQLMVSQGS